MKRFLYLTVFFLYIFSFFTFSSLTAFASTVLFLDIESLQVQSQFIVIGKARASQSFWDEKQQKIFTKHSIELSETFKDFENSSDYKTKSNDHISETITIITLGGEIPKLGMRVPGEADFAKDEEILLFLLPHHLFSKSFRVLGMSQGKWNIFIHPQTSEKFAYPSTKNLNLVMNQAQEGLKQEHSPIKLSMLRENLLKRFPPLQKMPEQIQQKQNSFSKKSK